MFPQTWVFHKLWFYVFHSHERLVVFCAFMLFVLYFRFVESATCQDSLASLLHVQYPDILQFLYPNVVLLLAVWTPNLLNNTSTHLFSPWVSITMIITIAFICLVDV